MEPAAVPPEQNRPFDKDYPMCFGCGRANPCGLKLRFRWEHGHAVTEFTPIDVHQGWPGIVHGGVMNALLDEAMGYQTYFQALNTVTARMSVRFRRTARIGETLRLTGETVKLAKRVVEVSATAALEDGTIVAESSATMFVLSPEQMAQHGIG